FAILYLESAFSARKDGGLNNANNNYCSKECSGRGERFFAPSGHRLHRVLCRQRQAGRTFLQNGVWLSKPCLLRPGDRDERSSELRDSSEHAHLCPDHADLAK